MKVTINKAEEANSDFPKLMIGKKTNIIILAIDKSGENCIGGVVVCKNETHPVGYFCHSWSIISFEDFKGSITLENE